jgi:ATP-dependent Lon protease
MQESARAALSYIRSRSAELNIQDDWFEQHDIHLHVPGGSVPKDGPSAGITIATALASLITQRPVHGNIAMTGEITLRGQVLPIGGLKEKILAAHRFGLDTVIIPKRNEQDLDDLPEEVQREMHFVPVEHVDQVLNIALAKPLSKVKKRPHSEAGEKVLRAT